MPPTANIPPSPANNHLTENSATKNVLWGTAIGFVVGGAAGALVTANTYLGKKFYEEFGYNTNLPPPAQMFGVALTGSVLVGSVLGFALPLGAALGEILRKCLSTRPNNV